MDSETSNAASPIKNSDIEPNTNRVRQLRFVDRCLLLGGGIALFVLFGIAARLTPAPAGMGTHQQLGLPPCTFVLMFQTPCPTCGMTTSWSNMMHGRIGDAIRCNIGGVMLWMLAASVGIWMFVSGVRGHWFIGKPNSTMWLCVLLPIGLVTIFTWLLRLNIN